MDLQEHIIKEFSSPITQESYRQLAEKGLWKSEEHIIKSYFKKRSAVLDLGCGTGRTTIPLKRMGYRVIGVDITPAMIRTAKAIARKKKLAITYATGDATKLTHKDNAFDNIIFSNNGWSQIPGEQNRIQAIKEMRRVLKPGGIAFFTTHVRTLKGFKWLWTKQWMKHHVLKPLGFRMQEQEYGDIFFKREANGQAYEQRQYIHIPRPERIKELWQAEGFDVVLMKRTNDMFPGDNPSSPMCYVCRRQP